MADPTVLGRYHLVEPLGGGPTGEVFRAKMYGVAGFERQFAVKRFHAALVADPAAASALASAARTYGGLSHPRIAALHEHDGSFQAVELVEGLDLLRLVAATTGAGEAMPPGARLGILSQVARVVAYAHGRGVAHLGICPTNAIATPDGDVKVCDFGSLVARLRGRPAEDATLAARLPYLAPEQLQGAAGTAASDVFCLATLGFELVSGERAFGGKTPAEIAARLSQVAPRPPDLPDSVAEVFRRAFLPRPEDRFPDAGALADALDGALRRATLPGGRGDIASAVRRALARAAEQRAQGASGAVSFPLPAPPRTLPNIPLPETPTEVHELHESALVEERTPAPVPKRSTIPPPIPREPRHAFEDVTPPNVWKPTTSPGGGRRVLLIAIIICALGGGGLLVWSQAGQKVAIVEAIDAGTTIDDRPVVAAPPDAAPAATPAATSPAPASAPPDARPVAVPPAPEPPGKLVITSSPSGALVYLDGAAKGRTPVELPASGDRHRLALLLAGHKLHRTEVTGGGRIEARLEPAVRLRGPAGIKVLCKSKNRFYVTVDGVETGMLCPTERIAVSLGKHTVEIYDAVSDAASTHPLDVRETHHSVRIKLEN